MTGLCCNNASLGAKGRKGWKERGPLLMFNPLWSSLRRRLIFSKVKQLEHFSKILRSLRVNFALFHLNYNSKLTKINSFVIFGKSWELSVAEVSNILVPGSNKYQICMLSGLLETTSIVISTCILSFVLYRIFKSNIYALLKYCTVRVRRCKVASTWIIVLLHRTSVLKSCTIASHIYRLCAQTTGCSLPPPPPLPLHVSAAKAGRNNLY